MQRERIYRLTLFSLVLLSSIGLLCSMVTHISALGGHSIIGMPFSVVLHLGAMLIGFSIVGLQQLDRPVRSVAGGSRDTFRDAPFWMRWGVWLLGAYVLIGFIRAKLAHESVIEPPGPLSPHALLAFSRYWMFFFAAETTFLYGVIKRELRDFGH